MTPPAPAAETTDCTRSEVAAPPRKRRRRQPAKKAKKRMPAVMRIRWAVIRRTRRPLGAEDRPDGLTRDLDDPVDLGRGHDERRRIVDGVPRGGGRAAHRAGARHQAAL